MRFGVYPALGVSWWWAYVVAGSGGSPLIAGLRLERPHSGQAGPPFHLQERGTSIRIERAERSSRWHLSVESAAASSFALDVAWESVDDVYPYRRGRRYEQAGWTTGTVTVAGLDRAVEGPGQRDHSWGVRDWWRFPWSWAAGWLADGARFQATQLEARRRVLADGYLLGADGKRRQLRTVDVVEPPVTKGQARLRLDDMDLSLSDVTTMTIELLSPEGRTSRLARSMSTVTCADGRWGVAWRERNEPVPRRAAPR